MRARESRELTRSLNWMTAIIGKEHTVWNDGVKWKRGIRSAECGTVRVKIHGHEDAREAGLNEKLKIGKLKMRTASGEGQGGVRILTQRRKGAEGL